MSELISPLFSVSPIDGRYRSQVKELSDYFSEYALIKYRVYVEVEYFIALCEYPLPQLKSVNKGIYPKLRSVYKNFSETDALQIKKTESITNHDVKAVEYFIKEQFDSLGLAEHKEFIHFGLTSQDINNTATPLMLKDAIGKIYLPLLDSIINELSQLSEDW
ncbi:MAG TPA: lyase family protein, partial [Bacteroidia bacterium]|nr:lyase family protein [Bacteroidia bacterium]